jgi:integrase
LPAAVISTALILHAIEPLWARKSSTASTLRGRIESVLDWAATRGHRQGDNPARWRGHLANLLPAPGKVARVAHFAAIPYTEVGSVMAKLQPTASIPARALEFLILTAARSGEVLGAKWDELDLNQRVWTIPAERMKAGREHRVPLSDAAMAVVEAMAEIRMSDYLFPGIGTGRPLAHDAMSRALHRLGREETVHGFRSGFSQWGAERTSYPFEVRELALAHAVGSQVERSYQRSDLFDRRRRLMDDWADFCAKPPSAGKVVPIRG